MTDKPFGVNLTFLPALTPPDYPAYAKVIAASERDTRLAMRPLRSTERILTNPAVERLLDKERELGDKVEFKDIVDEVGGECEIICDGGIRRGTHVLKALASGATACSMGRPYLFGLAAGGQEGVSKAVELLRAEIIRGMGLIGCRSISEIGSKHIA